MRKEITVIIERGRVTVTTGDAIRHAVPTSGEAELLLTAAVDRRSAEDVARLVATMIGTAIADAVIEQEGG